VEAAQHPGSLPACLDASQAVRIQRFVAGSFAGLAFVGPNLLLIWGLVKCWSNARRRRVLLVCVVAGLTFQLLIVGWIGTRGLRQLSPEFQQAIEVPTTAAIVLAAAMVVVATATFAWRLLAKAAHVEGTEPSDAPNLFFYERWQASLLLGAMAMMPVAATLVDTIQSNLSRTIFPFPLWEELLYSLSFPAELLCLAVAIGGFALAVVYWRRRREIVADVLPRIDPAEFAVTAVSLCIFVATAAPILAVAGFSYWFVGIDR
jgi:hypothetical protein